ncbi:bifunctional 5,10-methylenetetrahydrofolate dehydrogenase/5,10-methenyltetrahydrofolate cyclohydrolase [Candidatus Uhrbacteria bacterium]|nr:bifunctional 5,10-methylenetetrahydrofolate dehydrogenase/5,10-methenyltetrahydrofolate cyclohydrolase [Candidatus Uhrbacteria bacterium]
MATLIDGKALAARIRTNVQARVEQLREKPGLAVLLVGNDPASHTYVALKEKACQEAGIRFEKRLYPPDVSETKLIADIEELNGRADVHGILVQLPLPAQDPDRVVAAIRPDKDVDGFHPENIRRLDVGLPGIVSPVALGILKLIDVTGIPFKGQKAVIVASSFFAHPIEVLLHDRGMDSATVSPDDPSWTDALREADVVVVAIGRPGYIQGNMLKPGAVVIDVGTTRVGDQLVGDADRESVKPIAGWLTPVPGGVGPMTVAMLLVSVLKAYQLQRHHKRP